MTLEKAIEILENSYKTRRRIWLKDYFTALKLGIEALKHLQKQRVDLLIHAYKPLPGEE